MNREYPTHPLPGVLAVVVEGGKALLVQRGREPNLGIWGFPGGLIELGESPGEAAMRELAEETGVVAEAGPVIDVLDAITRDADGRVRYHFLLVAVRCRRLSGDPAAADDADAVGWFDVDAIASMPCVPQLARLMAAALHEH